MLMMQMILIANMGYYKCLLAIQEELARFLLKEVIDKKYGRFHVNR
jgi:hypothetical protein